MPQNTPLHLIKAHNEMITMTGSTWEWEKEGRGKKKYTNTFIAVQSKLPNANLHLPLKF